MMAMTAAQCMDLLIEAGLYLSGALYDSETAVTSVTYDSKEATTVPCFSARARRLKQSILWKRCAAARSAM